MNIVDLITEKHWKFTRANDGIAPKFLLLGAAIEKRFWREVIRTSPCQITQTETYMGMKIVRHGTDFDVSVALSYDPQQ